jgi:hypothetical protein
MIVGMMCLGAETEEAGGKLVRKRENGYIVARGGLGPLGTTR